MYPKTWKAACCADEWIVLRAGRSRLPETRPGLPHVKLQVHRSRPHSGRRMSCDHFGKWSPGLNVKVRQQLRQLSLGIVYEVFIAQPMASGADHHWTPTSNNARARSPVA